MALVSGMVKSVASFVVGAVIAGATLPAAAQVTVNFTASGDSETVALDNGLDATVTLDANNSGSVLLTPDVAQTVDLNDGTLDFFVLNSAGTGTDTLSQTLTITSPGATPAARTISQGVTVQTALGETIFDPGTGSVFVQAGNPVTFDLGPSGTLTVTPLFGGAVNRSFSPTFFTNSAEFLLTGAVPEPAALSLLAGGAAVLAVRRRRRSI